MMTIDYRISNLNTVLQNIDNIVQKIHSSAYTGLDKSCDIVRDSAIEYLDMSVGTGRWPSLGVSTDSIRSKTTWGKQGMADKFRLFCKSKHAAVVEFGAIGAAMVERPGSSPPFPIGKQQGLNPPMYRQRFAVQKGYNYLTRAIESPYVHRQILQEITQSISQGLFGISLRVR